MKIALVHDHLAQDGGAEKVLKALKEIYPKAPIFTLVFDPKNTNSFFNKQDIRTSFIQKIPYFGVKKYQWWLSLMPTAVENYNLMEYDIILSSASSFAKGIITKPGSTHLCYCYTPTRYLWTDTHSYIRELKVNALIKYILPLTLRELRTWDQLAANRVDEFIAISQTVRQRIKKYYGRDSSIIYPPVDTHKFYISHEPKKYYLAGSRLVPYKKIDLVVKAFSRLNVPIKIFGIGPEEKYLKKLAGKKSNIEFLGKVSDDEKVKLYSNCIAYINPQEEDFGITAIEAMASGRPVIAYRAGGTAETVIDQKTGEFFDEQIWEDIADKIIRFNPDKYNPYYIKMHAQQFNTNNFKNKIKMLIDNYLAVQSDLKL